MASGKGKIIVTVTNDLLTDQRADKVCRTLLEHGYEVVLVGRRFRQSTPITDRPYEIRRFRLLFNRGALFYTEFNIRLFIWLLFQRCKITYSNDLDTLAANALSSILLRRFLIYDSHEYFTEVPELVDRPFVKRIWKRIEKWSLPHVDRAITVSESVAEAYQRQYGISMTVIRNMPYANAALRSSKAPITLNSGDKKILYQGVLNRDRGLEEVIDAMQHLNGYHLYLAGSGDVESELKDLVDRLDLSNQVTFLGRIPLEELHLVTAQVDLGVSLEKDVGLNYRYALPNKVFDYVQAEIPIVCSRLIELEKLQEEHQVLTFIDNHNSAHIAEVISNLFENPQRLTQLKEQLSMAAKKWYWEREGQKLLGLLP